MEKDEHPALEKTLPTGRQASGTVFSLASPPGPPWVHPSDALSLGPVMMHAGPQRRGSLGLALGGLQAQRRHLVPSRRPGKRPLASPKEQRRGTQKEPVFGAWKALAAKGGREAAQGQPA